MALFNDLFTESTQDETVDYLKDLPLARFAEDASFLDCGSKGLVLAEAGWTDICETVNNMDTLDEALDDVADKFKTGVEKAGAKLKAGVSKVKEFLSKVPEYLKKIAQNIFGTINKFLTSLAALAKSDQNILDIEAAKAGLSRYKSVNEKLLIKGFLFDSEGDLKKADDKFRTSIGKGKTAIGVMYQTVISTGTKKMAEIEDMREGTDELIKTMRQILIGEQPSNGPVTSKSFKTDLKASYGKKSKDGVEVTDDILSRAIGIVKSGYKDAQKSARNVYKDARAQINEWIGLCNKLSASYDKSFKENKDKDYFDKASKNVELMGNTMLKCAGMMSSYTGAYCQLLHENYSSLRKALMTCVGYSKGGKAGKKVYGESDTSIFGLDLI